MISAIDCMVTINPWHFRSHLRPVERPPPPRASTDCHKPCRCVAGKRYKHKTLFDHATRYWWRLLECVTSPLPLRRNNRVVLFQLSNQSKYWHAIFLKISWSPGMCHYVATNRFLWVGDKHGRGARVRHNLICDDCGDVVPEKTYCRICGTNNFATRFMTSRFVTGALSR